MSEDMALVREFAARQSEPAFATLVGRYLGLVHSAAVRQVGDPHLAEEITQAVFLLLARKARSLGPDTILSAWLYRATRYAAADALKIQRRRQRREQEAYMQSTLNGPDADVWALVAPLLDEAMAELRERDRTALVLRFFENKPAREIAGALKLTEDAAQKRVARALEKLRAIFTKRGVTLTGAAIASAVSANSIQAVPIGLAAKISAAAVLAGTTIATTTAIVMTTLQKTIIGATLAAAVGAGIYEARQAANARTEVQALQQQQAPLAEQVEQLTRERDDAMRQLAKLREDNERLNRNTGELLRLRGEASRLRADSLELARLRSEGTNETAEAIARAWTARVNLLKDHVRRNPSSVIPEVQFAGERGWLYSVDPTAPFGLLKNEDDYRQAMEALQDLAEVGFHSLINNALVRFSKSKERPFPTDLNQLQTYLDPAVTGVLLQEYELVSTTNLSQNAIYPNSTLAGDWMIARKSSWREYGGRFAIVPVKLKDGQSAYQMSHY